MGNISSLVFKTVQFIFWILFIGLCVKTGAILVSAGISLFVDSGAAMEIPAGLNLLGVLEFSQTHYVFTVFALAILTGLKAYIAYLVIKLFLSFNLQHPFSSITGKHIAAISRFSLYTGLFAVISSVYFEWLRNSGNDIPVDLGSGEILFFAAVLYIISQIFRKGIELQTETDLTV